MGVANAAPAAMRGASAIVVEAAGEGRGGARPAAAPTFHPAEETA